MNIGFISSWLHRGASYVTINYMKMLKEHDLYVYARGGEYFDECLNFENASIYKAKRLGGTIIDGNELLKWIKKNQIEILIVNEQDEVEAICKVKLECPDLKIGAYIDYYTEKTVNNYYAYDFLICNTKRHYSVFNWHPQCFYLPWCVDTDLYLPSKKKNSELTFFHSMGMSNRKGTDTLIKTFIDYHLGKKAKLIIHTQKDISNLISEREACENNIEIIKKTVQPPGLYNLGDIYVYPTTLDGLGLTMYEALSSGMPVIATNDAPMNEIIDSSRGVMVEVEKFISRSDGYYWPLAFVSQKSLYHAMNMYIDNVNLIKQHKINAREYAVSNLSIEICEKKCKKIIDSVESLKNMEWCEHYLKRKKMQKKVERKHEFIDLFVPNKFESSIRNFIEKKRR